VETVFKKMRKKEKQVKLIKAERVSRDPRVAAFNRRKAELRELYKQYKVGIVTEEELTDEQRVLLKKYFGV